MFGHLDSIKKLLSIGISIDFKSLRYPIPQDCTKSYVKDFFTNSKENGGRSYSIEEYQKLKTDDIVYCESGFFRNKIIIPIYNEIGEQISFVARTLDNSVLEKYRYPLGFKKNLFVYRIEADSKEPPVICEGIFDGLQIQGIWGRTALVIFGSSMTSQQIGWVAKNYDKVDFALDGDISGRKGVAKALNKINQFGIENRVFDLPENSDPPNISKNNCESLIIGSKDFLKKYEDTLCFVM